MASITLRQTSQPGKPDKQTLRQLGGILGAYSVLTIAAFISALSTVLYLVPAHIIPGGLSGIAIILNYLIGTPVGFVTLLLNIPMMVIGWRLLGGRRVVARTIYFTVAFTVLIDLLTPLLPADGITHDLLLAAIFSGVMSGISSGLCFAVSATGGGTTIATRILNARFGIPVSTASLYIDGAIIGGSVLVFGWEAAMYAIVSIVIYGAVTDYVMEGPSMIRTATIITNHPQDVADVILHRLHRGVTGWQARGMYTAQERTVLFVTINRAEVSTLRQLVTTTDPSAFMVIGQGHVAYGQGFKPVAKPQITPSQPKEATNVDYISRERKTSTD